MPDRRGGQKGLTWQTIPSSGYADVNGIQLDREIYGSDEPVWQSVW